MTPRDRSRRRWSGTASRAAFQRLWLHRGAGVGSASDEALALYHAHGLQPVTDLCPVHGAARRGLVPPFAPVGPAAEDGAPAIGSGPGLRRVVTERGRHRLRQIL